VLVTFDHSRKSSYYSVKSIVHSGPAERRDVLVTKPIDEEEPAALLWPYVRDLAQSQPGKSRSKLRTALTPIPTDRSAGMGHYMTSREWLDGEKRTKHTEEFARRWKTII
jgi:hypothetical protein